MKSRQLEENQNRVCLYIATHNKTGLKYFGKTIRYFTQEELQKYYHGSGSYWKRHLKKYGNDVTMEIYGIYNLDEVEKVALKFSEDNNIINERFITGSRKGKKVWANTKFEDGGDGGAHSEATKIKIGNAHRGKIVSVEARHNMSKAQKGIQAGERNGMYGNNHSEESKQKIIKSKEKLINFEGREMTVLERSKIKLSRTTKGTELGKKKSQKSADTIALRNPIYNIFHIEKGLIKENVQQRELRKISQSLKNKTKENYMGKSKQGKSALIRNNLSNLLGYYVERIVE